MYQVVLHKVHVHPPHPEKDNDKYKEEYDEDYLTFLINLSKFNIGRLTDMGSLVVGN